MFHHTNIATSALNSSKNDHEHYNTKRNNISVLLVSKSPQFQSGLLFYQPFSSYMPLKSTALNGPNRILNIARSNVPYVSVIIITILPLLFPQQPAPHSQVECLLAASASNDKNDIGHFGVKGATYMFYQYPESQISVNFALGWLLFDIFESVSEQGLESL